MMIMKFSSVCFNRFISVFILFNINLVPVLMAREPAALQANRDISGSQIPVSNAMSSVMVSDKKRITAERDPPGFPPGTDNPYLDKKTFRVPIVRQLNLSHRKTLHYHTKNVGSRFQSNSNKRHPSIPNTPTSTIVSAAAVRRSENKRNFIMHRVKHKTKNTRIRGKRDRFQQPKKGYDNKQKQSKQRPSSQSQGDTFPLHSQRLMKRDETFSAGRYSDGNLTPMPEGGGEGSEKSDNDGGHSEDSNIPTLSSQAFTVAEANPMNGVDQGTESFRLQSNELSRSNPGLLIGEIDDEVKVINQDDITSHKNTPPSAISLFATVTELMENVAELYLQQAQDRQRIAALERKYRSQQSDLKLSHTKVNLITLNLKDFESSLSDLQSLAGDLKGRLSSVRSNYQRFRKDVDVFKKKIQSELLNTETDLKECKEAMTRLSEYEDQLQMVDVLKDVQTNVSLLNDSIQTLIDLVGSNGQMLSISNNQIAYLKDSVKNVQNVCEAIKTNTSEIENGLRSLKHLYNISKSQMIKTRDYSFAGSAEPAVNVSSINSEERSKAISPGPSQSVLNLLQSIVIEHSQQQLDNVGNNGLEPSEQTITENKTRKSRNLPRLVESIKTYTTKNFTTEKEKHHNESFLSTFEKKRTQLANTSSRDRSFLNDIILNIVQPVKSNSKPTLSSKSTLPAYDQHNVYSTIFKEKFIYGEYLSSRFEPNTANVESSFTFISTHDSSFGKIKLNELQQVLSHSSTASHYFSMGMMSHSYESDISFKTEPHSDSQIYASVDLRDSTEFLPSVTSLEGSPNSGNIHLQETLSLAQTVLTEQYDLISSSSLALQFRPTLFPKDLSINATLWHLPHSSFESPLPVEPTASITYYKLTEDQESHSPSLYISPTSTIQHETFSSNALSHKINNVIYSFDKLGATLSSSFEANTVISLDDNSKEDTLPFFISENMQSASSLYANLEPSYTLPFDTSVTNSFQFDLTVAKHSEDIYASSFESQTVIKPVSVNTYDVTVKQDLSTVNPTLNRADIKKESDGNSELQDYIKNLESRVKFLEDLISNRTMSGKSIAWDLIENIVSNKTSTFREEMMEQNKSLNNAIIQWKKELSYTSKQWRMELVKAVSNLSRQLSSHDVRLEQVQSLSGKTSVLLAQLTNQVATINMSEFITKLRESLRQFTLNVLTIDQWTIAREQLANATLDNEVRISRVTETMAETSHSVSKLHDTMSNVHVSTFRWYRSLQGHVIRLNNTLQDMQDAIEEIKGQQLSKSPSPAKGTIELPAATQSKLNSLNIQLLYNANRLARLENNILNNTLAQCKKTAGQLLLEVNVRKMEEAQQQLTAEMNTIQEKVKGVDLSLFRVQDTLVTQEDKVNYLESRVLDLGTVQPQLTTLKREVDNLLYHVPKDCQGYFSRGFRTSGVFVIHPDKVTRSVRVYCVMETPNDMTGTYLGSRGSDGNNYLNESNINEQTFFDREDNYPEELEGYGNENGKVQRRDDQKDEENNGIRNEFQLDSSESYIGGWTVIQRRLSGMVNFTRSWSDYTQGFGQSSGEYWLGNELIHLLTHQAKYELRVLMKDVFAATWEARYLDFQIDGEASNYRIHVTGYYGNASDGLSYSNKMSFSCVDRDNDASSSHCALFNGGGWWYSHCYVSNLNGPYDIGMVWFNRAWQDWVQLKETIMMIRPKA